MIDNNKIKIVDDFNNEKEFEIIAYINIDLGNFVVYTDGRMLNEKQVALYVSCLVEVNNELKLESVNSDELSAVMDVLKERLRENE